MAHFAFTVPDVKALISEVRLRKPDLHLGNPGCGLDNRWAFNLFDADGARTEFMQVADPSHPAPPIAVTPENWSNQRNSPK